jgi:hypothetical protein
MRRSFVAFLSAATATTRGRSQGKTPKPSFHNVAINRAMISEGIPKMIDLINSRLQEFNYVNMCTAINRISRLGPTEIMSLTLQLHRLLKSTSEKLHSTPPGPDQLADLCWSLQRLTSLDTLPADMSTLMSHIHKTIADEVIQRVHEFPTDMLLKLSCSFIKAGVGSPSLWCEIAKRCENELDKLTPTDLAAGAWILAKTGYVCVCVWFFSFFLSFFLSGLVVGLNQFFP